MPGLLNLYTKTDTPSFGIISEKEIPCSGNFKYLNHPIDDFVAVTKFIAEKTLNKARTAYSDVTKPIYDVKSATKIYQRNTTESQTNEASEKRTNVNGHFYFTMEKLVCVTKLADESLEEHVSSQFMDGIKVMVSKFLDVDCNSVDVCTRRLGGGYGVRIIQLALACGFATHKLNRPYRLIHPLWTTTRPVGKNFPCSADFEMAVNSFGITQFLNYNIHQDNGCTRLMRI